MASCILRFNVCSWDRKAFLASCWVMVLPPSAKLPVGQVGKNGAEDADRVDADVFIEAVVFGSDEGILQILRHFVDVDGQAVLIGMKGRDQPAVGIEDL